MIHRVPQRVGVRSWVLSEPGVLLSSDPWAASRPGDTGFSGKVDSLGLCCKWRGGEHTGLKWLVAFLEVALSIPRRGKWFGLFSQGTTNT